MSRKKVSAPFSLFAFQDAITSVCGVVVLITLMLALELTRRVTDEGATGVDATAVDAVNDELATLRDELEVARQSVESTSELNVQASSLTEGEIRDALKRAQERLQTARDEAKTIEERQATLEETKSKIASLETKNQELTRQVQDEEEILELAREQLDDALSPKTVRWQFSTEDGQTPWFVDLSEKNVVVVSPKEKRSFNGARDFVRWVKKTRSKDSEYFVLIVRPSGTEAYREIFDKLDDEGYRFGIDAVGETRVLEFVHANEDEQEDKGNKS